jgi:hypothetical protein
VVRGLIIMLSLVGACGAQASDWTRYEGGRFSVALDHPTFLADPIHSDNGDGVRLQGEGAELAVWGAHHVLEETPYRALCSDDCAGESYRLDKPRVAVSSGTQDGRISYSKCVLAQDELHCFRLSYPASSAARFNDIVKRMSGSLR